MSSDKKIMILRKHYLLWLLYNGYYLISVKLLLMDIHTYSTKLLMMYVWMTNIYVFLCLVLLVYQEKKWKAEEILLEEYQHEVQTRLLESRKWLQNISITSKAIDTSAIVELFSLEQQLEQTQRNYDKQPSKLTLELKE